MKPSLRALSICACVALSGLLVRSAVAPASYTDRGKLVAGESQFAVELFRTLANANPNKNIAVSPYSVSLALESLALASRGETQTQIMRALHIESLPLNRALNASRGIREEIEDVEQPDFELGNQFVGSSSGVEVRPAFQKLLADYFGPNQRVFPVDIATGSGQGEATRAINERTAGLTSRRVLEVVSPNLLRSTDKIVVVSAASLNGRWAERLASAEPITFTTATGKRVAVPQLTSRPAGAILGYLRGVGWRAVVLPYEGARVSMVLVLPDPGQLAKVQRVFDRTMLENIVLDSRKKKVLFDAPIFGADLRVDDLGGVLAELGVTSIFSRARADLTPVTGTRGLAVDAAVHYGALRFTADAETAGGARPSIPADQSVTIDRPFLYAVVDRPTGTVLFLGRVLDPSAD